MRYSLLLILVLTQLGGCGWLSVYKIDVQQGNSLNDDAIDRLRVGMTPEQVRYVMGTPLVHDLFRPDRWDYVYYFKPGKGEAEERRLTVFFEDGRVSKIDHFDNYVSPNT